MAWYCIRSASGDRYVGNLSGEKTTGCSVITLTRCPEPWEAVASDGTITADTAKKAALEATAALNQLSRTDLFDLAMQTARSKLIDDMANAGVITVEEAASLQESAP